MTDKKGKESNLEMQQINLQEEQKTSPLRKQPSQYQAPSTTNLSDLDQESQESQETHSEIRVDTPGSTSTSTKLPSRSETKIQYFAGTIYMTLSLFKLGLLCSSFVLVVMAWISGIVANNNQECANLNVFTRTCLLVSINKTSWLVPSYHFRYFFTAAFSLDFVQSHFTFMIWIESFFTYFYLVFGFFFVFHIEFSYCNILGYASKIITKFLQSKIYDVLVLFVVLCVITLMVPFIVMCLVFDMVCMKLCKEDHCKTTRYVYDGFVDRLYLDLPEFDSASDMLLVDKSKVFKNYQGFYRTRNSKKNK